MNQYVSSTERVDLFLKPLLPVASGTLALATAYIETSRMNRNILTIAIREANLDQSRKGTIQVEEVCETFRSAKFAALSNYAVILEGVPKTDIDIAAYKDGILFLGQAKVVIHPDTAHEHRAVRNKLVSAARQMKRCLDHLDSYKADLLHRLGAPSIRTRGIVAFVTTNVWDYTGVEVGGLPVVDFSYLSLLLTGGAISLVREDVDGSLSALSSRVIKGKRPTANELRVRIESPLARYMFERPEGSKLGLIEIAGHKVHLPTRGVLMKLKAAPKEQ